MTEAAPELLAKCNTQIPSIVTESMAEATRYHTLSAAFFLWVSGVMCWVEVVLCLEGGMGGSGMEGWSVIKWAHAAFSCHGDGRTDS
jgi:hypothetical protein